MKGDLEDCYDHVHRMVEKYRLAGGLSRQQVFFNVDLLHGASDTYAVRHPQASRNSLLYAFAILPFFAFTFSASMVCLLLGDCRADVL